MIDHASPAPASPLDKIREQACRDIAALGMRHFRRLARAKADTASGSDATFALIMGMLTGVAGIVISVMDEGDESHMEIRAMLAGIVPLAFDQARSRINLPPLPEVH